VVELLASPERAAAAGAAGREVVERNRGALDRLLTEVETLLAG
jgi:hypothetical protein